MQTAHDLELTSYDNRSRLTRLVMSLFDHWDLSSSDQALLLGYPAKAHRTISRYRRGGRIDHLLDIHKSLRIIFPHDRDLAYRWVTTPNRRFDGKTPLDIMTTGYEGLFTVHRYLDYVKRQ